MLTTADMRMQCLFFCFFGVFLANAYGRMDLSFWPFLVNSLYFPVALTLHFLYKLPQSLRLWFFANQFNRSNLVYFFLLALESEVYARKVVLCMHYIITKLISRILLATNIFSWVKSIRFPDTHCLSAYYVNR